MRNVLYAVAAAILLFNAAAPPHAAAYCPRPNSQTWVYYNGCGARPTYAGDYGWDCPGLTWSNGTLDGHWMVEYTAACTLNTDPPQWYCMEGDPTYKYYEKCNGSWVQRTYNDFLNGNCQCS